jgi:hypothetical protein
MFLTSICAACLIVFPERIERIKSITDTINPAV